MTVQHDEAIVTAAHTVHDKVWATHWKKGETGLEAAQVIEYVREVRTVAKCNEERLPKPLQDLVAQARERRKEGGTMKLVELLGPLNQIILPPAPKAA